MECLSGKSIPLDPKSVSYSFSLAVGPPVGGLLYNHYGYRAPFIFGIIASVLDLLGRLLIIERRTANLYGVDPAAGLNIAPENAVKEIHKQASPNEQLCPDSVKKEGTSDQDPQKHLSLFAVIGRLSNSSRALVSLFIIFIYGYDCCLLRCHQFFAEAVLPHTVLSTVDKNQPFHYTCKTAGT